VMGRGEPLGTIGRAVGRPGDAEGGSRPRIRSADDRGLTTLSWRGRSRRGSPPAPRADDRGLTTLSWLLIVAAVAGLAALAVVLVSAAISETAGDIAAEHPRHKAARLDADSITDKARAKLSATGPGNESSLNDDYGTRCNQLAIIYRGLDLEFEWHDAVAGSPRPIGDADEASCEVVGGD